MTTDPSQAKQPTARQLAHLQATGQLTDDEVLALESGDEAESEAAMRALRVRHASARLQKAVAAGSVSEHEAAELVEQLKDGGHSAALRARVNELTREGNATRQRDER